MLTPVEDWIWHAEWPESRRERMWLHWVADKDRIVGDVGNHRWEHVFIYVFSVFVCFYLYVEGFNNVR